MGIRLPLFPKKQETTMPRRRLVLLAWGREKSLRDVAGHWTLLVDSITDRSVAERLRACRPWGRALLAPMVPCPTTRPAPRRLLVVAGRVGAGGAPAAPDAVARLHGPGPVPRALAHGHRHQPVAERGGCRLAARPR